MDVTPSRPDDEALGSAKLPLNLPAGWDFDAVFGEAPAAQPAPPMRKAQGGAVQRMAMADTRMIAAAPSPEAAGMAAASAGLTTGVVLPQTATLAKRDMMIGLLMILFAAMLLVTTRMLWGTYAPDTDSRRR